MDEVAHDRDLDLAGSGLGLDAVDLVLGPVDEATQVRWWVGSRRSASSKIEAMTVAARWTTLTVSHWLLASGGADRTVSASRPMMSVEPGGAVSGRIRHRSSAIRLRTRFSPLDARVVNLAVACAADLAVAGRNASGLITTAFAVRGQYQQVTLGDRGPGARRVGVEGLKVGCGAGRALLGPAFGGPHAAGPPDRVAGVLEAAPRGLDRGQLP